MNGRTEDDGTATPPVPADPIDPDITMVELRRRSEELGRKIEAHLKALRQR
ncbi:hypothetical protein [Streptomyces otsuchiensis]|uniref:hypothetical protein n=1 Tax=Streptomyces otsuchiensis TaxID=2681388 RepID=UPI001300A075|nr:hypothetical protein [Streptomyces otsuchiensis]